MTLPATGSIYTHQYAVRQISMRNTLEGGSKGQVYPENYQAKCINQHGYGRSGTINSYASSSGLYMEQDILNADPADRVFDMWAITLGGHRCNVINSDEYHLERVITYQNCTVASDSCPLIDIALPSNAMRGQLNRNIVDDATKQAWGHDRFRMLEFTDTALPAGDYEISYRVCLSGKAHQSRTPPCTAWRHTGRIAVPDAAPSRAYPAGINFYTD